MGGPISEVLFLRDLRAAIAGAYRDACALELEALKPGNVHRYADGHGMRVADFQASAEASAIPLTDPTLRLGERIYRAIEATRSVVGCNTNLGIVLLCAPLVQALLDGEGASGLRVRLGSVLRRADREDTDWLFRAIRLAEPGGLGASRRHDVGESATAPLSAVMAYAASWDQIARAYSDDFEDLFGRAVPLLEDFTQRWGDERWAATAVYMDLLSRSPDTHVTRKHGGRKAAEVSRRAGPLARALAECDRPADFRESLLRLDGEFKRDGVNPGTSADLTVASLLILRLRSMSVPLEPITGIPRFPGSRTLGFGTNFIP